MRDFKQKTLDLHKKNIGKLDVIPNVSLDTIEDMNMAYTPGVAIPCMEIYEDKEKAYDYTLKGKTVAIVTDGSAVLGLGNIGPEAALPVMEGKAALLYRYSKIQAFPICIDTKTPDEIIDTVIKIAPTFSAIMLEDIKAPECVYIENVLQERLNIPVFHDDQHGTAIVVGAALKNASRLLSKDFRDLKIVVSGTGAAGNAVIRLLKFAGVHSIYAYNRHGIVHKSKLDDYNEVVKDMLNDELIISPDIEIDTLGKLVEDKDVFIGVSAKNILSKSMVKSMSDTRIVFALANPDPEINPVLAKEAGAKIIGTGRSDYPNQINNVLVFPGLMKGVLESRAKSITYDMKYTAMNALSSMVLDNELSENYILPSIFNEKVVGVIAKAIIKSTKK
ncbi:MAG: NADP-dependent malic enzyme [Tenericutes bacterium]|nr:NADP-dependent malic enzyme [Mycoplasmatota bacterium]